MKQPLAKPAAVPATTDPAPRRKAARQLDEAELEHVLGGGNKEWNDDWLAPK